MRRLLGKHGKKEEGRRKKGKKGKEGKEEEIINHKGTETQRKKKTSSSPHLPISPLPSEDKI
jgi:hypothetical protein